MGIRQIMIEGDSMRQEIGETDQGRRIICHQVYIGEGVVGYVYRSRSGNYHIFIADTLSPERQAEILAHELHHIKHESALPTYIIGLDMQHEKFELSANAYASRSAGAILALMSNAN